MKPVSFKDVKILSDFDVAVAGSHRPKKVSFLTKTPPPKRTKPLTVQQEFLVEHLKTIMKFGHCTKEEAIERMKEVLKTEKMCDTCGEFISKNWLYDYCESCLSDADIIC
jgi:hypothetical protein